MTTIVFHILLAGFLILSGPADGHAAARDESTVKAAFILNFAKLTTWPGEFTKGTFTVAVIGRKPPPAFTAVFRGQTVHGAAIEVRHVETVREAREAQVLFFSDHDPQRMSAALREAMHWPLLTVSDQPDFCAAGGMINLVPLHRHLAFEINLGAVRKGRLSVSPHLLKLARTVMGA